jgi:hypothetical protein
MKSFFQKIGVLMALLLTLPTFSMSDDTNTSVPILKLIDSQFILEGKNNLDPRSIEKIDAMGSELFVKTGISVYIYATERYRNIKFDDTRSKMAFIKSFENNITKNLKDPFVLLSVSVEDTHINLIYSESLNTVLDKNDILDHYIIPVLASKDKNSVYAKMSAGLLNGYAAIVDAIAENKKIELQSSIGSGGTTFSAIWRVIMYFIIVSGLLAYTYAVLKARKK